MSSHDSGFFGKGIYVTPNSEYAAKYAFGHGGIGTNYDPHPHDPTLRAVLLCSVCVGLAYPVTREVDYGGRSSGNSDLYGHPLKSGCDAHLALVHANKGYQAVDHEYAQYGEVVVSQYAAVLPLAILWVKATA